MEFKEMNQENLLAYADELVEKIKEMEEEKARFREIAETRIKAINSTLDEKLTKLDNWVGAFKQSLLQISNISTTIS